MVQVQRIKGSSSVDELINQVNAFLEGIHENDLLDVQIDKKGKEALIFYKTRMDEEPNLLNPENKILK